MTRGATIGAKSDENRAPTSRLCRGGRPPQAAAAAPEPQEATTAAVTDGVALETTSADGGTVISRGFAKAMDVFEDSLRVAAEAELGSTGAGSKQLQRTKKESSGAAAAAAATRTNSASGSQQSGETTTSNTTNPLYRPVARGLGLRGRQKQPAFRGEGSVNGVGRRGGSLSSLTVCARRPLLGVIAKCGPRLSSSMVVAPEGREGGRRSETGAASDEDVSGSGNTVGSGVPEGKEQQTRFNNHHHRAAGGGVEVQVWNYRTKRLFVRHRFGGGDAWDGDGGNGDNLVGSVIAAGGDDQRVGGGGVDADAEGGEGTGGGEGEGDATSPVAVSLHPSGDSIAVAFPHFVNVFYVVGSGGEAIDDQDGGDGVADMAISSKDTLSMSLQQAGVAETLAASDMAPLATLRSDQREFLTKGIFSVSGEQEQVLNCDPVSAVHYSPGGHLLAVVTGKVSKTHNNRLPLWQEPIKIELGGRTSDAAYRRASGGGHSACLIYSGSPYSCMEGGWKCVSSDGSLLFFFDKWVGRKSRLSIPGRHAHRGVSNEKRNHPSVAPRAPLTTIPLAALVPSPRPPPTTFPPLLVPLRFPLKFFFPSQVVQVLGVHSGTAGGRLGRVQTLSGHASDVSSFCWGADDRRCWTTADGYIFEWEVYTHG